MEKEKRPVHKRWWFWLVIILIIPAIVGIKQGITESTKETSSIEVSNEQSSEEQKEKPKVIEHSEIFAFGEFTVKDISTEIIDNELVLKFTWINQSGMDKTPYTTLGYLDVSQDGEQLEIKSGNPQIHDRNANGGELPVTLKYDLINIEPVRVLFGATSEYDDTKEELIIEID